MRTNPEPLFGPRIITLLEVLCNEHNLPIPRVEWSPRMRRMLGRAVATPPTIRLSAWLSETQAADTLRHELAHFAAGMHRFGRRDEGPHGQTWRNWAARLGARPSAYAPTPPANVPASSIEDYVWGLECPSCGVRFIRRRVLGGIYHKDCGPAPGKLRRAFRDSTDRVAEWVRSGQHETGVVPHGR